MTVNKNIDGYKENDKGNKLLLCLKTTYWTKKNAYLT